MKLARSLFLSVILGLGCSNTDATYAIVDNGYPGVNQGTSASTAITVYRGWWLVATFTTPAVAGGVSESERVVPGTDYAYVLLAPGWDPTSGSAPTTLIPAMTKAQVTAQGGGTLHIQVDDAHVVGNCAGGQPLAQGQADLITHSIFPGLFAGVSYDAATCTSTRTGDGGADGGPDAGDGGDAGDAADAAVDAAGADAGDAGGPIDASFDVAEGASAG